MGFLCCCNTEEQIQQQNSLLLEKSKKEDLLWDYVTVCELGKGAYSTVVFAVEVMT